MGRVPLVREPIVGTSVRRMQRGNRFDRYTDRAVEISHVLQVLFIIYYHFENYEAMISQW